ncbi:MAG: transketolase [Christensenellaceae bacterium]|jgi:transketolase|nr:transketolase [Christensenellaceae bacterium]
MLDNQRELLERMSADIRIQFLKMFGKLGFGHVGGCASIADVLAVLYGGMMRVDPANPAAQDRDWLVLSKGHAAPALYAALALRGFFPMEWLATLNMPGTKLPSHADARTVPGIDFCTGSLGQGISAAVGICLANRLKGQSSWVYCILGDGELNEGQVFEACGTAAHYGLDHFICFVDWNKKQLDGTLAQVQNPVDIAGKFKAFGFDTQMARGYDVEDIHACILRAKDAPDAPHCIVLDTYKGLGIDFAEEQEHNHHLVCSAEQCAAAIEEIERRLKEGCYPGGMRYGKA